MTELLRAEKILQAALQAGPEGFVRDVLCVHDALGAALTADERVGFSISAALLDLDASDAAPILSALPLATVQLDSPGYRVRLSPQEAQRHPLVRDYVAADFVQMLAGLSWAGGASVCLVPGFPGMGEVLVRRLAGGAGAPFHDAAVTVGFTGTTGDIRATFYFSPDLSADGTVIAGRSITGQFVTIMGAAVRIKAMVEAEIIPAPVITPPTVPAGEGVPPGAVVH